MKKTATACPPETAASSRRFAHSLSVFFPAYNDAPSLPALIGKAFRVLDELVDDFEVIVVNDGSADNTGEVLAQLQEQYGPLLRVITHPENRGYGGALRTGFAAATKEFIFYTDGDGQYDVGDLGPLLEVIGPQVGLVNGYKIARQDPWHRKVIGAVYNQFARFLFGVRLRDIDCDFRIFRRSLLEKMPLRSSSGTICVELVKLLERSGMEVVELPVRHYPRLHGRSQFFRVKSLATTFVQLCRLYWSR
jgi:glycosyltransferase involved in cell wall biosynthesis